MEFRSKAGVFFTFLGIALFGFGVYLLIGTSFFFLGNGIIASGHVILLIIYDFFHLYGIGLGMLIGMDKIKKARWIIWFLRKIPVLRQVLSLPIIWHVCNYICPEEPDDGKKK